MITRFGLSELESFYRQTKVGRAEIKTIKLILGVIGLPNKIMEDAKSAVSRRASEIKQNIEDSISVRVSEEASETALSQEIEILTVGRARGRKLAKVQLTTNKEFGQMFQKDLDRINKIIKLFE